MPYADIGRQLQQSAVTWNDISWIRTAWGGPIVVKGVHNLEDARRAQDHGAQAIVISNHGGRQLDRVLPTLHILRRVAPALKDCGMDILMDGGIRSGSDVVVALASGAKAVQVGRASPPAAGPASIASASAFSQESVRLRTGSCLDWGRGRRALRWTLAGFVALLLAYVGSRFVMEVVLSRSLA